MSLATSAAQSCSPPEDTVTPDTPTKISPPFGVGERRGRLCDGGAAGAVAVLRYGRDVDDEPAHSGPVGDTRPDTTLADRPAVLGEKDLDAVSARRLRSQHPELDWSDPEGALETLALLNDPEAMADLEEADNNIANDDLLPLDRYAPPL